MTNEDWEKIREVTKRVIEEMAQAIRIAEVGKKNDKKKASAK